MTAMVRCAEVVELVWMEMALTSVLVQLGRLDLTAAEVCTLFCSVSLPDQPPFINGFISCAAVDPNYDIHCTSPDARKTLLYPFSMEGITDFTIFMYVLSDQVDGTGTFFSLYGTE